MKHHCFCCSIKVRDSNDWWTWFDRTLLPNVRVQLWYNQNPPYRLRGYLDDRVNRLIGYAIVRQVREKDSHCPRPRVFRSHIVECTGAGGIDNEDDKDFCAGWNKWGSPNCTIMDEFKYTSAASINASTTTAKGPYMTSTKAFLDPFPLYLTHTHTLMQILTYNFQLLFGYYSLADVIYGSSHSTTTTAAEATFSRSGATSTTSISACRISRR